MSNWTLIEHLTGALNRSQVGDPKSPTLWPSEASAIITNKYDEKEVVGKCRRQTFFRFLIASYQYDDTEYKDYKTLVEFLLQNTEKPDRYLQWIWAMGELYEEYMIQKSKDSGVYMYSQVPIYLKEYNLSGKIDLVTINPQTHLLSKTEIKSVYGHNADQVVGVQGPRKKVFGEPRSSNLMQIALYDYKKLESDIAFGPSTLVYGARDTGRFSEFKVKTMLNEETGLTEIFYKQTAPFESQTIKSPITINSILTDGYKFVSDSLKNRSIPERDYTLAYTEERIAKLYERKELNKADTERFEKRALIEKENQERALAGDKLKKQILPIELGDWQCRLCQFKNICYTKEGTSREI